MLAQTLLPGMPFLAVAALGREPLPVLVQVNTSGEESKYGVEPKDCVALATHIHESCKHLRLAGLMTIGMPGEVCSAWSTADQCPVLPLLINRLCIVSYACTLKC